MAKDVGALVGGKVQRGVLHGPGDSPGGWVRVCWVKVEGGGLIGFGAGAGRAGRWEVGSGVAVGVGVGVMATLCTGSVWPGRSPGLLSSAWHGPGAVLDAADVRHAGHTALLRAQRSQPSQPRPPPGQRADAGVQLLDVVLLAQVAAHGHLVKVVRHQQLHVQPQAARALARQGLEPVGVGAGGQWCGRVPGRVG